MGAGLPHQCEEAPQEAGLKVVARLNTIRLQKCTAMDLHTSDSKCADQNLLQHTPFHARGQSAAANEVACSLICRTRDWTNSISIELGTDRRPLCDAACCLEQAIS